MGAGHGPRRRRAGHGGHEVRLGGRCWARTRTITTTTAVGTSAEASSHRVLDLVTGQPVRNIDPLGRVTSYLYDDAGRQVSRTTPDGLTTTSSFTRATPTTPASRTDTTPDGRVVLTTYDVLGRKVRVTDNVQDQAFTDSPTTRQVSAFDYSLDGTTLTATDQHGRTIHTTLDVLGRKVSQIGATGITRTTTYDDAAHTTTQAIVPDGATRLPGAAHHHATTTPTGPSPSNTTTTTGPPTPPRPPPSTGSAASSPNSPTISSWSTPTSVPAAPRPPRPPPP